MAKKPNMPCRECGTLMWRQAGGLPEGEATCRDCRGVARWGTGRTHGRPSTYRAGCRCDLCRAANTVRLAPSNARRRAQVRGADVARFNPRDIFVRDGWLCGICGDPVDTSAKFPHPLSVSLDHIEPLSLGGSHTPENTRCAHYSCNARRGNRVEASHAG